MRFAQCVSALVAMAATALAQTADFDPITRPSAGEVVPAGQKFQIQWDPKSYGDHTVKIELLGGPTNLTLATRSTIATNVPNSARSYEWIVDKKLGADPVYGLRISSEKVTTIFQFSMPFSIKGSGNSPADTTSSAGTGTTTQGHGTKSTSTTANDSMTKATGTPCSTTQSKVTGQPNSKTTCSTSHTTSYPSVMNTTRPRNTTSTTGLTDVPTAAAAAVGVRSLGVIAGLVAAFAL